MKIAEIVFAMLLLSGVANASNPNREAGWRSKQVAQFLQLNEGGVLRGVGFDMKREDILRKESLNGNVFDRTDSVTVFLSSVSSGIPDYTSVTYYFDSEGLFRIVFKCMLLNNEASKELCFSAMDLLEHYYGNCVNTDNGCRLWEGVDVQSGHSFEVIADMTNHKHSGFIIEYLCKR